MESHEFTRLRHRIYVHPQHCAVSVIRFAIAHDPRHPPTRIQLKYTPRYCTFILIRRDPGPIDDLHDTITVLCNPLDEEER